MKLFNEKGKDVRIVKTEKLLFCLMLIVLGCLLFSTCIPKSNLNVKNTKSIMDMTGTFVMMPNEINRVFVEGGSATTLVLTLGAVDKVLVLHPNYDTKTFAWLNVICPQIKNIEKNDVPFNNVEALLQYEPDIVITIEKDNIEKYRNVGLPVIYVSLTDYESCKQAMEILGSVLGEKELAAALRYNDFLDENLELTKLRLSGVNDVNKKSVYYMDSRFDDVYHTVGVGEIQETWIKLAGGKFATEDLSGRNLLITAEKILQINPDIIFIGSGGMNSASIHKQMLTADTTLANLTAVKNNDIVIMPRGIFSWCRTGPEFCMQMVWAAKYLHPDKFEDIDIIKMAKNFYRTFYGSDISDKDIAQILAGEFPLNDDR